MPKDRPLVGVFQPDPANPLFGSALIETEMRQLQAALRALDDPDAGDDEIIEVLDRMFRALVDIAGQAAGQAHLTQRQARRNTAAVGRKADKPKPAKKTAKKAPAKKTAKKQAAAKKAPAKKTAKKQAAKKTAKK